MKPLLVYGSKTFGAIVRALAEDCGRRFAGYIDDWNSGPRILGPLSQVARTHPPGDFDLALAVGYQHLQARRRLFAELRAIGYALPVLIHPRAYVREPDRVGEGAFVMAMAAVDTNATIGEGAVIWPGAAVSHDSAIGANTFVSPNATICGCVTVGESCFIGAGATIVDHLAVPAETFIKAGSVYSAREATGMRVQSR